MEKDLKHSDITGKVIGCAMKVHRHFGLGFPERVYQNCLIIELEKEGLKCTAETCRDIYYEGKLVGTRRLDLLVEDKVLVELKAVSEIDKTFSNQVINYLRVFDMEVGLLLNFGQESLFFKRYIYSKSK